MSESIQINFHAAEEEAEGLENAATVFQPSALTPEDDKTTLTANIQLKSAIEESQALLAAFGAAIDTEAVNIRSTGAAFEEYDRILADLMEQIREN